MKQFFFLFFAALYSFHAFGQDNSVFLIRGYIQDAQSFEYLPGASVTCLKASDSSKLIAKFTDDNGFFCFDSIPRMSYVLYVTYLSYKSISISIPLRSNNITVDTNRIFMERNGVTLTGVDILGSRSPVRVVKDTVEFNSTSYKVREHSVLEELLRKLPGVQVEVDGTIRINGEVVKTILIDGRPFFASDPKVVVKNLQVDMIDKVQLIDRKLKERDPASFDLEQTEKAINITIKKARRNLWSGEIMGGYGLNSQFSVRANISRFAENRQLAAFVGGDNINGYMDGSGVGSGVQKKWNPNFSYATDLSSKLSFNSSYVMQDNSREDLRQSIRRTFIEDTSYYYKQNSRQKNVFKSHSLSSKATYEIDSTWSLVLTNNFIFSNDDSQTMSDHSTFGNNLQLLDSGWISNTSNRRVSGGSSSFSVNKKLKKEGHSLSASLSFTKYHTKESNYNLSNTFYKSSDDEPDGDTVNQHGKTFDNSTSIQYLMTYTSPVFTGVFLSLSYGIVRNTKTNYATTYNFNILNNYYDELEDSLSGSFRNSIVNNIGRIGIRGKRKELEYDVSLYAMFIGLTTKNLASGSDLEYSSTMIFPRVYLNYNFTQSKRLKMLFSGNSILPSFDQLQPVPNNSNPLFIKLGNPKLETGSLYSFSLSYNSFRTTNMRLFGLVLSGNIFRNQIVNGIRIDSLKRQVSQPTNVDGSYDFRISIENSFTIGDQTSINTITNWAIRRDMNVINGIIGANNNFSISQTVALNYNYKELFSLSTGGDATYFNARYSDLSYSKDRYFSCGLLLNATVRIPLGITIGSNLSYILNTGRGEGFNSSALMLNAFISKEIFANRKGAVKLHGFDILGQSIGVNRTMGTNYIEDVKANVLQRFFMLSFTYFIKQHRNETR